MNIQLKIAFKIVACFVFCVGFNAHSQTVNPSKPMEVYLLIGQSNMAGRGTVDAQSQNTSVDILMLDKTNNWVGAKDPVHFDRPAAGVGPAVSFAQAMLQDKPNTQIGLIPCAWGGSPIKVWQPGAKYFDNFPYDEAIARAKIAMQKGVLKGILWHQGETDNNPKKMEVYLEKLKTLVGNLRRDLNAPNLPFVAGEIGYFNKVNNINEVINKLPAEVENTAVVSAKDLTDRGDQLHFDTPSARELGKRYAVAMKNLEQPSAEAKKTAAKKLEQSSKITQKATVVLTFDDAEISHYTNVASLLSKYGFNATFFVCEFPIKNPGDEKELMNWNQIRELHKKGFEIGNHTGHHKDLTKLSLEDVKKEVGYIEEKCKEFGIPKPISLAYPGNRQDTIAQRIVKSMGYQFGRTGGARYYKVKEDPKLAIPSYTVISSDKYKARTLNALRNLKGEDVLVLTFHGVPDILHPKYSTSIDFLNEILQYLKENKIKVVAMRNL
ncbi:Peptidoglycan/xylan/chitin deacetylase, PgdA/CDA1 family [Flavobacterium fluvii]|uniref:Peptidoglycan/xylan/chitin deacetylase, PgdA/CDA1 family n=1 Tax=Flavobacterium fluvii TaxID=468056 RepID=A0A1M5PKI3_9FLAO|nr:sialate O-acetylesterase [Flavobacterium fluvii]SHH02278.1 Peptidoglycan/xylan/chitin deacetylase, PgdA/CDA1 family [Flavobacterium fluvii]